MMAMSARLFSGLLAAAALLFVGAPILIVGAPYESTMGLIQKIFYFHVPSWIAMFLGVFVCGISSAVYLFRGKASADRLAAGAAVEAIGTFLLVLAVIAVALNPRAWRDWAPLVIGLSLTFIILVFGPLTGASVNPARWFGPALVSDEFGGTWPYLLGPVVGAFAAVALYRFVIEPGEEEGERQRTPGT